MQDAVSENNEAILAGVPNAGAVAGAVAGANAVTRVAAGSVAQTITEALSETGAEAGAETGAETDERPSLFCGFDGSCVNPHEAIPIAARDSFARNFRSHFAAALGETLHAA